MQIVCQFQNLFKKTILSILKNKNLLINIISWYKISVEVKAGSARLVNLLVGRNTKVSPKTHT